MHYGKLIEILQELEVVMKDRDDINSHCSTIERLKVHIFCPQKVGKKENRIHYSK